MALVTCVILLSIIRVTLGGDCVINNVPEQMAWEKQLRKDLKCNYHIYEPPGKNGSIIPVNLRFVMKYFNFNSREEKFSVQTWIFISWKDERLKWDPEKYFGINQTEMSSFRLWTPSLRLYNSADSNDFDRFFYVRCRVNNNGNVLCIPKTTHDAICSINLAKWPYDVQECNLEFGPWISKSNKFKLNITSRAITMIGAEFGAEWYISDYRQVVDHNSERQLKMTFVLVREAAGLAAVVVYPSWILTALSVTCLYLDPRRRVRLGVATFSLLSHYYFLAEMALDIPKLSVSPPTLLIYYRSSVIVTVTIIFSTFALSRICKLKSIPQNYILSVNEFVYGSYGRFLVFPRWDIDDIPTDKQFIEDWTKFANVVNSVFMLSIIITYISLYCSLMPQPVPVNF